MRRYELSYLGGCLLCLLAMQAFVLGQTPEPTPAASPVTTPEVSPSPLPVTTPTPEVSPTPEPLPVAPENLIHLGDLVDIDVLGSTEFDWRGTLTPEGFLNGVEFVEEPIYALCQTEEAVARKIAEGYAKLLKNPQVSVRVLDRSGRPVSFLYGAVRQPQRFKLNRAVTLGELIVLSGGLTEKASGEIQILRSPNLSCRARLEKEKETPAETQLVEAKQEDSTNFTVIKIADLLKGDKRANPLILNGDVITVRETQPIYITGGVANPRQISGLSKMTVTRSIASAGGFLKNADREKIVVFRREGGETRVIEVNLRKIEAKEEEDLELRAFDVVEVGIQGREKRKTPPALQAADTGEKKYADLPLRIVN